MTPAQYEDAARALAYAMRLRIGRSGGGVLTVADDGEQGRYGTWAEAFQELKGKRQQQVTAGENTEGTAAPVGDFRSPAKMQRAVEQLASVLNATAERANGVVTVTFRDGRQAEFPSWKEAWHRLNAIRMDQVQPKQQAEGRKNMRRNKGFYVMTYGGGRYTSVGWYPTKEEAEKEVQRLKDKGAWSGKPPKVEADDKEPTKPLHRKTPHYKVFTNQSKAWVRKDAGSGPGLDPFGGKKEEYLEANGLDDVTVSEEYPDDDQGFQFNEELTEALNALTAAIANVYNQVGRVAVGAEPEPAMKRLRSKSNEDLEPKAYQEGYTFGKKDADRGRKSDDILALNDAGWVGNNLIESFLQGYNEGYRDNECGKSPRRKGLDELKRAIARGTTDETVKELDTIAAETNDESVRTDAQYASRMLKAGEEMRALDAMERIEEAMEPTEAVTEDMFDTEGEPYQVEETDIVVEEDFDKRLKRARRKFHPNTLQSGESLHTPHQDLGPAATAKAGDKYVVWVKERGQPWEENGEGPLTRAQADRIARETKQDTGVATKVLPAGQEPEEKSLPRRKHTDGNWLVVTPQGGIEGTLMSQADAQALAGQSGNRAVTVAQFAEEKRLKRLKRRKAYQEDEEQHVHNEADEATDEAQAADMEYYCMNSSCGYEFEPGEYEASEDGACPNCGSYRVVNRSLRRKTRQPSDDISSAKAREMLRDGTAHGRKLSDKQHNMLEAAAHRGKRVKGAQTAEEDRTRHAAATGKPVRVRGETGDEEVRGQAALDRLERGRRSKGFMEEQVEHGRWVIADTDIGTEAIPLDVTGEPPAESDDEEADKAAVLAWLGDYIEGREVYNWEIKEGYGARLSAPGYIDATEWGVYDTEEEARDALREMYGDDEEMEEDEEKSAANINNPDKVDKDDAMMEEGMEEEAVEMGALSKAVATLSKTLAANDTVVYKTLGV